MRLKCSLGIHSWTGCKCLSCGKVRDDGHDWAKDCEKCAVCGQVRKGSHVWKGRKCAACSQDLDSALIRAIDDCNVDEVRALLAAGANAIAVKDGICAVHCAMSNICYSVHRWEKETEWLGIIDLLVDAGADIDALGEHHIPRDRWTDYRKVTPLMCAVVHCRPKSVEWLIKRGANTAISTRDSGTAFRLAMNNRRDAHKPDYWDVVRILARHTVDGREWSQTPEGREWEQDREGDPAAPLGVSPMGAWDVLQRLTPAQEADVIKWVEAGGDVNWTTKWGWTLLHFAARNDARALVCLLIDRGANVNARTNDNKRTPLHEACDARYHVTVAQMLFEKGADPNAPDIGGDTPLLIVRHSQGAGKPCSDNAKKIEDIFESPRASTTRDNDCPAASGKMWYLAQSLDKAVSQIVLSAPVALVRETEFSTIMLPYDRFPILASEPWCTGLIRMANKPVPYQMIRVDKFDDDVQKSDMTIAFSFCKMKSGGIFLIDARIDDESLARPVRERFSTAPPIDKPVAEWVVGVGDSYSVKMIEDVFAAPALNIIVANSKGTHTEIMVPNGNSINCAGPRAHHERSVPFENGLNECLKRELAQLVAHHNAVPSSRRNFEQANRELGEMMLVDKDPVFPRGVSQ